MLRYNKNEPFQKLRDLIFSYFIAHPDEAEQFKTELNNLREAEDFYDFVIPSIQHRKFNTSAKFTGITKDGFCSFDWQNKTLNIPTLDKNWATNYYVPSLLIEQLAGSPHKYMNYKTKGKVLVDCGAAEGFFALDNIEGFERIVLIDGDQKWIRALKKTFEIFLGDNVELIESFLTAENFEKFDVLNTPLDDSVIKLDIEGYETEIISQLLYKQQTAKKIGRAHV